MSTILFSLVLLSIEPVYAQNLRENEVVVIDGEKFVLHQVKTGETIYSLTKKFNVDRSELEKYNPELLDKERYLAISKADMLDEDLMKEISAELKGIPHMFFSSVTGLNIQVLKDKIWEILNS